MMFEISMPFDIWKYLSTMLFDIRKNLTTMPFEILNLLINFPVFPLTRKIASICL